jgi:hypothetical protein
VKKDRVIRSPGHRVIESQRRFGFRFSMTRSPDHYSPAGTRFNAFFTVPRSIMIFSCSRVMA